MLESTTDKSIAPSDSSPLWNPRTAEAMAAAVLFWMKFVRVKCEVDWQCSRILSFLKIQKQSTHVFIGAVGLREHGIKEPNYPSFSRVKHGNEKLNGWEGRRMCRRRACAHWTFVNFEAPSDRRGEREEKAEGWLLLRFRFCLLVFLDIKRERWKKELKWLGAVTFSPYICAWTITTISWRLFSRPCFWWWCFRVKQLKLFIFIFLRLFL